MGGHGTSGWVQLHTVCTWLLTTWASSAWRDVAMSLLLYATILVMNLIKSLPPQCDSSASCLQRAAREYWGATKAFTKDTWDNVGG